MRKLWKRCSLIFLSAIFTFTFANGCQKQQAHENTKDRQAGKEISYSIFSPITSLDPQKLNQMDASTVGYHIYEGLVRNEEGRIVPAGAAEWKISGDGLKYTFTLRETCWKDGSRITAKDYVRGIKRLAEENTESDYGFLVYSIKNGAAVQQGALKPKKLGVKALDDNHVEITLERKTDYFLQILSMVQFSPIPENAVKKAGGEFGRTVEFLWENGPFFVAEWGEDKLVLKKNEHYWNAEKVILDQVVITRKNSIKEARKAYENGETNLFTSLYLPSEEDADYNLYSDGQFVMVRLNLDKKKLANEDFRKALLYAIDQNELNDRVYEGVQSPATGFLLPETLEAETKEETEDKKTTSETKKAGATSDAEKAGKTDAEKTKETYSPEKAKAYMEKARKKLKWDSKKPWKFTLICSDYELRQQTAAFLKESWEEILGIQVEIQAVSSDERLDLEAKGEFDLILSKWVPDVGDASGYLENWESDSPYNQGHFTSKTFDNLMKKAEKKVGEERISLLLEAEKVLVDKVPAIPLYFRNKVLMTKKEVTGIRVYYIGYQYNYIYCDVKQ